MVFFQVEQDSDHLLRVSPNWWLYLAVTLPLTAVVLILWIGWLKWKDRSTAPLFLESKQKPG